jgi:hypothetical protein
MMILPAEKWGYHGLPYFQTTPPKICGCSCRYLSTRKSLGWAVNIPRTNAVKTASVDWFKEQIAGTPAKKIWLVVYLPL